MITVDLLSLAKKINNYAADATGGGLWTSTVAFRVTVPASKRWFVVGGYVLRDASATMNVRLFDSSDNIIHQYDVQSAATGYSNWPTGAATSSTVQRFPLDAGEYLQITFGAAQGAGAYASAVVLEIDV